MGASRDLVGVREPSGVEEPFMMGDFCRMLDMMAPEHPGQLCSCVRCHPGCTLLVASITFDPDVVAAL